MKDVYKVVACDIDSTLVKRHEPMAQRTLQLIHVLRSKGILFGLASGRPVRDVQTMASRWKCPTDFIIGMNGAALWDGKKEYAYHLMKKEWIKETIDLMKPFDANPFIYEGQDVVCVKYDDMVRLSAENVDRNIKIVTDISSLWARDNAKILYRVPAEQMEQIEEYVKEHPSPYYQGYKTQRTLYEFSNRLSNKGVALKEYCKMVSIPLEQVIAFGDTTNDNEMLQVAGCGVCMINGSADTKAVADIITEKSCDEQGWDDFVEKHLL